MDIKAKLSHEDQKALLSQLLGFDITANGVIYDCEGDEFYGYKENDPFDLSTIAGIVEYIKHQAESIGVWRAQEKMRQALGV